MDIDLFINQVEPIFLEKLSEHIDSPHSKYIACSHNDRENDKFGSWFSANCEKRKDLSVAHKFVMLVSEMRDQDVKDGMKRLGFPYLKDLSKMGQDQYGRAYKGGYRGVGYISPESD